MELFKNMDCGNLIDLVGDVGSLGLIFYLVWFMTTRTIPNMMKDFKEAILRKEEINNKQQEIIRKEFREALAEARCSYFEQLEKEHSTFEQILRTQNEFFRERFNSR